MKGTTKPKIHVVIKDVTKVSDHNGRKYKYTLVTKPLVLITAPLCIANGDIEWAMIKSFSKGHAGNIVRSVRDKVNADKEYHTECLQEYQDNLKEVNKKISMDSKWSKKDYYLRKKDLEKLIEEKKRLLNKSYSVKDFDRRIEGHLSIVWMTAQEKSEDVMGYYGDDNLAVAYKKQYKDKISPLLTYKHRNKPYGVTSRFERNMLEFIDVISNDLPSYKKTKRAKVKANKKTFRSTAKKEIQQGLDDYNHYRLMSAKEGFVADWYGSKAAVQLRALMHDDVYVTWYSYDDLEEVMSHLKQSENWEWHLEHVIPNHYLRPGEVCKKVYDYVIQDGRLVKTGYVNYNPMYREEEVIDYNADVNVWEITTMIGLTGMINQIAVTRKCKSK